MMHLRLDTSPKAGAISLDHSRVCSDKNNLKESENEEYGGMTTNETGEEIGSG
ncbi:hypothetical protein BDZ89DRAFT_1061528 [Hymenopellis radicata]|nr:hypothetical protein BDZ89DRAFT_1061528 [Hymenopellis radicata]